MIVGYARATQGRRWVFSETIRALVTARLCARRLLPCCGSALLPWERAWREISNLHQLIRNIGCNFMHKNISDWIHYASGAKEVSSDHDSSLTPRSMTGTQATALFRGQLGWLQPSLLILWPHPEKMQPHMSAVESNDATIPTWRRFNRPSP